MRKEYRVYAEGRPGQWEAVCLDLDIAVQGESLEQVVTELTAAIGEYLAYAQTLPEADRRRLLARRAPLGVRLKFLWHVLRGRRDGNDKQRADLLLPVAA